MTEAIPPKRIKIALQGGGSHGAFTWGVLDRLLDDPRLEIEAVVGTSAGAMNAALLVDGLAHGGPLAAKKKLCEFWTGVSSLAAASPLQPSLIDRMLSPGNMDFSPTWRLADVLNKVFSPYELNPANLNPLRHLLETIVDFARLRAGTGPALFISATNLLTGRLRVFARHEISLDAVMASACLPLMFQAVEVEGEHYWDGGYCGNPPIFPLIYMGGGPDVLIVQLNPINIPAVPQDVRGIIDRINTLSFNSSLMREMRMIKFVTDLIDKGELSPDHYLRINIHTIDAETELASFNTSSKYNADKTFMQHLQALGVAKAEEFLAAHFDEIGQRSSTDIVAKFF
ncbi:MAG TPA: patatin-like phospholipase family protein [Acidocella sp.]|jgi:NTE family protein|nr:patatin-like phospholipase family protein [Acidocella sp.]